MTQLDGVFFEKAFIPKVQVLQQGFTLLDNICGIYINMGTQVKLDILTKLTVCSLLVEDS